LDSDLRRFSKLPAPTEACRHEPIDIEALTRKLTKGDEAAYRVFYDAYFRRLSRYLLVVTTGDENAAREALQGMLIRLVKYARVFSDEKIFWSWLTVLARSSLSDDKRKRRRYLAFLDRFTLHIRLEQQAGTEDRLGELLKLQLSTLATRERQLIERKYFEHMPIRSIAEQMNMTEKAVESSLVRIRRRLKQSVLSELKNEPHT
jgi:RNA polymerase sigma-70 factor, ECF subfamily